MPHDMVEGVYSGNLDLHRELGPDQPRPLTHDEKKAAEAAFRGDPFNPGWSAAAARVYAGILSAMEKMQTTASPDSDMDTEWMAVR